MEIVPLRIPALGSVSAGLLCLDTYPLWDNCQRTLRRKRPQFFLHLVIQVVRSAPRVSDSTLIGLGTC